MPIDYDVFGLASDITFCIDIDLFNERDSPTGLRDIGVVFRDEQGEIEVKRPLYTRIVYYSVEDAQHAPPSKAINVVNLASGEWVRLETMAGFDGETLLEEKEKIKRCTQAEIYGKWPDGYQFRAPIFLRSLSR